MYDKLDSYLLDFINEDSSEDFWYDYAYMQAQELLNSFTQSDWEEMNKYGGWLMSADDIKGLTPIQIQEKFALPHLPEFVGEVVIPKGTTLRIGEVNPLFGHKGGGVQFDLKGQFVGDFKEVGTII